jgi:hypothetical protein
LGEGLGINYELAALFFCVGIGNTVARSDCGGDRKSTERKQLHVDLDCSLRQCFGQEICQILYGNTIPKPFALRVGVEMSDLVPRSAAAAIFRPDRPEGSDAANSGNEFRARREQ